MWAGGRLRARFVLPCPHGNPSLPVSSDPYPRSSLSLRPDLCSTSRYCASGLRAHLDLAFQYHNFGHGNMMYFIIFYLLDARRNDASCMLSHGTSRGRSYRRKSGEPAPSALHKGLIMRRERERVRERDIEGAGIKEGFGRANKEGSQGSEHWR